MVKLPLLKDARERKGLTQLELAEMAGVSRPTVTRIESGMEANPPTARKIAAALGLEPGDLMGPRDP
jgi:transcriptional regulator with XRE-family HTH domain